MTRSPVSSSNLVSIGYDEAHRTMEVEFKGGGVYEYDAISPDDLKALLHAPSIGKHLADHIKGRHAFRRVK